MDRCYKIYSKCNKSSYPISSNKKYNSHAELLFDKRIANIIDRSNTQLPYRDTQERLETLKAKMAYSKQIGKSGNAKCNSPWYYPSNLPTLPRKNSRYFY